MYSIDLIGDKSVFLKCTYAPISHLLCEPITEIYFCNIKNYQKKSDVLIVAEKDNIEPVAIGLYPRLASVSTKKVVAGRSRQELIVYRGNFDMSAHLGHERQEDTSLVSPLLYF